jgi:parallel beta helix pectate lyase-like protein/RNA polymerase alpha subunit
MNDTARQRLCELIAEHGPSLLQEPKRFEGLIRDRCGSASSILIHTMKQQIPSDLLGTSSSDPSPAVIGRLSRRLQGDFAMKAKEANWAVETWAIALGVAQDGQRSRPGARSSSAASDTLAARSTTTTAPSTTPPLIVSKVGSEHFQSIGAAIQGAKPGSRIVVYPGIYNEAIVLDKSLQLTGEGDLADIIVQNTNGECCLTMKTDYAVVGNLTMRGRAGLASKSAVTVSIPQGRLILEHCVVSSDSNACIYIHGPMANPIIRCCDLRDAANGSGVFCDDHSEGLIEDCDIYGNANANVVVQGQSSCSFRKCHIHDGQAEGVIVRGNSKPMLDDCEMATHAGVGVLVGDESDPLFRRCLVRDGKANGIIVSKESKGTFEDCEIVGHLEKYPAVVIREKSHPRFVRCRIHKSESHGLWFKDESGGSLESCEVRDSASANVRIEGHSSPVLRHCKIADGKSTGISFAQATGSVEDCEITRHASVGVQIDNESEPDLLRCSIASGKTSGIVISNGSKGTIQECEVVGHPAKYPAVVISDRSEPRLSRCRIHEAGSNGVWFRRQGSGSLENCQIYDTAQDAIDVEEESHPTLHDCVIRNSKSGGVTVRGKATCVLQVCEIVGNARSGVSVREASNAELLGCRVEGNGEYAIRVASKSKATVAYCGLSGNGRGPWDVPTDCQMRRFNNRADGQEFIEVKCERCGEDFQLDRAMAGTCPNPECRAVFTLNAAGEIIWPSEPFDVMTQEIAYLKLSVRARKRLARAHIVTIGDLVGQTADKLLTVPNFSVTSLNEVRNKLSQFGLRLRND